MIHPSYVDLMHVVNKGVEEGETPVINSRYSIVMATAKRARQIVDGDEPLIHITAGEKPLSIAVEELNQEKIHILADSVIEEEAADEQEDLVEVEGFYNEGEAFYNVEEQSNVEEDASYIEEKFYDEEASDEEDAAYYDEEDGTAEEMSEE